ncbi:hypothetical protein CPB83DRAFT_909679 [Crepidotus variabilis]|uniref:Transmembrane protein n=1 Tax=Crepidotus variabilis TaxID=179855 RepID=A0A9P6E8Q6_9AGAR|nr:hypothetical protein CPB83DRAFT_909679 [Crepidotus variabilis]
MAKRSIIVDDLDPSIKYEGNSWFADQGSQDRAGNFGPPFRSTLHGTQSSASLSFQFSGTSITVVGANNLRNDSGVLDPKWECFVDHISIGATDPFPYAENNWGFCNQDQLVDGPHTLTVNVTVAKKQTFWFDRIQYTPSPSASIENSIIYIENSDPELQYGPGWGALGGTANLTQTKGSLFEFEFTGVSLSWFSFIPQEFPGNATTGSYSIDGGSPQAFSLNGHPADSTTTVYNQKFFETPTLPMGKHKLSVVYNGNGDVTPLTLDYLVVQNGTAPSNNTTGSDNNNPVPVKKTNIGAIVGGIVSAVAVIILIIIAFLFFRRRRRQQYKRRSIDLHEEDPPVAQVHPFQYSPVHQSASFHPSSPTGVTSSAWGTSDGHQPGSSVYGGIAPANARLHQSNPSAGSRSDLHSTSGAMSSRNPVTPPADGSFGQPLFEKARDAMSQQSRGTSRVVLHEDSGVRNLHNPVEDVVELPPQYTAG